MDLISKGGIAYGVVRYDMRPGHTDGPAPLPPFGFPELGKADGRWQFVGTDNRMHVINQGCYLVAPVEGDGFGVCHVFGTAEEIQSLGRDLTDANLP